MPAPFNLDAAPVAPLPRAGERALIIAPHPDDESLGAGGWIYMARRQGADVRILYLTDGEAFRLAALTSERRFPSQAACRALGQRRRREAIAAAAALGVPEASLRFLGYPDRGLTALRRHWFPNSPFRSPHTGRSVVGKDGCRPERPYCGEALAKDLAEELDSFRPAYLLYPDPKDDHRDHRAAAWFAVQAMAQLGGAEPPAWVRTYLIHYGLWPAPLRIRPGAGLEPPSRLAKSDRTWEKVPLTPAALRAKAAALRSHESQNLWAADLFGAHLRTNELFALSRTKVTRQAKSRALTSFHPC